eukprot:gene10424-8373_t
MEGGIASIFSCEQLRASTLRGMNKDALFTKLFFALATSDDSVWNSEQFLFSCEQIRASTLRGMNKDALFTKLFFVLATSDYWLWNSDQFLSRDYPRMMTATLHFNQRPADLLIGRYMEAVAAKLAVRDTNADPFAPAGSQTVVVHTVEDMQAILNTVGIAGAHRLTEKWNTAFDLQCAYLVEVAVNTNYLRADRWLNLLKSLRQLGWACPALGDALTWALIRGPPELLSDQDLWDMMRLLPNIGAHSQGGGAAPPASYRVTAATVGDGSTASSTAGTEASQSGTSPSGWEAPGLYRSSSSLDQMGSGTAGPANVSATVSPYGGDWGGRGPNLENSAPQAESPVTSQTLASQGGPPTSQGQSISLPAAVQPKGGLPGRQLRSGRSYNLSNLPMSSSRLGITRAASQGSRSRSQAKAREDRKYYVTPAELEEWLVRAGSRLGGSFERMNPLPFASASSQPLSDANRTLPCRRPTFLWHQLPDSPLATQPDTPLEKTHLSFASISF